MIAANKLAVYAATPEQSRGRRYPEPETANRTPYQRDRDRIIHSGAFRRMEYKTQVFANHEGDLFRTRLTHSLEVSQIARSIARSLGLNEDLVEAIALAHDLGHTPFGHSGEWALNLCMQDYGGFEHNLQGLRVVDVLEERYGGFDGLNLTYETREGILKRCSMEHALELGDIGSRFLENKQPTLEAQVTNLSDEIAYNSHDVDDGLRAGLLQPAQLMEVDLFARYWHEVQALMPDISERRAIYETIRRMISAQVTDVRETTQERVASLSLQHVDDVRNAPLLVTYSEKMEKEVLVLKDFLRRKLYRHYQVNRMSSKARRVVRQLFDIFMAEPELLPDDIKHDGSKAVLARVITDYIAAMTDRYAMREYRRLFEIEAL